MTSKNLNDDAPHGRVLILAVGAGLLMAAMVLAPRLPGNLPFTMGPPLQALVLGLFATDIGAGRDVDSVEFKTLPTLCIFFAHLAAAVWPWVDALVILAFILILSRHEVWEWQRQQLAIVLGGLVGMVTFPWACPFEPTLAWAIAAFSFGLITFTLTSRWGLIGLTLVEGRRAS